MGFQAWGEPLVVMTAAGQLYNSYTTAKSVLTSATALAGASSGLITLPANFFDRPGKGLHIFGVAGVSNRVTGPDTFSIEVHIASVIAFTTGNINLTTTAHTTIPMWFDILLTCRTTGSGTLATLMGQAHLRGQMVAQLASAADNAAGTGYAMAPNTAPAVGTGFDSTAASALDLWVGQSVSNAGNGFQLQQYCVFALN